jgi:hypothetical protein
MRATPPPLPPTSAPPALPVVSKNPAPIPPPLPAATSPAPARNPFIPAPVAAPPPLATAPVVIQARVHFSDDLPDLLDGRARNRRALMVVIGVALLALLATIAAAIASHYRPM